LSGRVHVKSEPGKLENSFLAYRLRLMARTGEPVFLAGKLSVRLALRFCCPAQVFKKLPGSGF